MALDEPWPVLSIATTLQVQGICQHSPIFSLRIHLPAFFTVDAACCVLCSPTAQALQTLDMACEADREHFGDLVGLSAARRKTAGVPEHDKKAGDQFRSSA